MSATHHRRAAEHLRKAAEAHELAAKHLDANKPAEAEDAVQKAEEHTAEAHNAAAQAKA